MDLRETQEKIKEVRPMLSFLSFGSSLQWKERMYTLKLTLLSSLSLSHTFLLRLFLSFLFSSPSPSSAMLLPSPLLARLLPPLRTSRQKLNSLRTEADASIARAEDAESKNKKYEQEILTKDQDITSLSHKVSLLEADLEKTEAKLTEAKAHHEEGETHKGANESLNRKVQLLEEELDTAEKNLKDTVEK